MNKTLELMNKLNAEGLLKPMVESGIIPMSVYLHYQIYLKVDSYIFIGIKKSNAVTWVAEQFNLKERQVYYCIKKFTA